MTRPTRYTLKISWQLSWLLFHGTNLTLVVEPCHYTQVEMDRTRVLLSQITLRASTFSEDLSIELSVFYKMLFLKSTNYTPLGMCVLGRPLILAILGAVTTYLVIIFQFRSSDAK
ncbi:gustatory receptor for sugar taste 43a-like [Colias croceus]|uniref:gustatory receptor for sugar taste 43a-like n=1 Tax=Colias crocea TaxID=72248 RepID=UPI001E27B0F9|nr:gustatory receptor for sugar taste 43a-like [Colias croceus]